MKLIHTGDLHIGKIVNEFSMIEDQRDILRKIVSIAVEEKADGIILAGDVYDRSIPPAEAVTLLDWFLTEFVKRKIKVFLISGNHDSAERLGFASDIMDGKGIYIAGAYNGTLKKVTIKEEQLTVNLYLLPFLKPQTVRYYEELAGRLPGKEGAAAEDVSAENTSSEDTLEEKASEEKEPEDNTSEEIDEIHTFEEGVRCVLKQAKLNPEECNILVTHHFVTSGGQLPEQSDSENGLSLGGIDNVDTAVFDGFDYVALGHIHRAQRIGRDTIRYSGTPLKYSFSECLHKKSVTVLDISSEKEITIHTRELVPLHDMRKIKGNLSDLMNPIYYEQADTNDYIQATLTDEVELVDPIGTLRSVYLNVMQIIIAKNLKEHEELTGDLSVRKSKTPMELFEEFFSHVTGREFDEERRSIVEEVIEQTTGGNAR